MFGLQLVISWALTGSELFLYLQAIKKKKIRKKRLLFLVHKQFLFWEKEFCHNKYFSCSTFLKKQKAWLSWFGPVLNHDYPRTDRILKQTTWLFFCKDVFIGVANVRDAAWTQPQPAAEGSPSTSQTRSAVWLRVCFCLFKKCIYVR